MRLIDADALAKELMHDGLGYQYNRVINAPTVDAEPVRHGEWIDEGFYAEYRNEHAYRCSECGWHMLSYPEDRFRYCPSCGAKMDGKGEK